MDGVREDLIVALDGIDRQALLEFWSWLIPGSIHPWFATALGDLYLVGPDTEIVWLDVGLGQLQTVAANEDEFQQLVADPDNYSLWFGAVLVDSLRRAGKLLKPGECYSYWTLPMLGGEYEPGNFRIYDVVTHFRVWGPIHEQLRDIPDGTQVVFKVVNPPD